MLERDLEAAISAAQAGAEVLMRHFRRLEPGQINEKTKHDLVSVADRESEAAIRAVLEARCPGYGFLGEETGASGDAAQRWVVDPLDGTLNFVQGFPHWCVSIGLEDEAGGRVACILDPLRGDCFTAARGQGALWNGKPMAVSSQGGLDGAFLALGFAYQMTPRLSQFMPVFEAALKQARVFAGPDRRLWTSPTRRRACSTASSNWGSNPGMSQLGRSWWRRRAVSSPTGTAIGKPGAEPGI